jgi:hypothetical protein
MGGGQLGAFPVIGELSVRIGDTVSITELCKCSNEGERGMNRPERGLAAVRLFFAVRRTNWGESKIRVPWRTIEGGSGGSGFAMM